MSVTKDSVLASVVSADVEKRSVSQSVAGGASQIFTPDNLDAINFALCRLHFGWFGAAEAICEGIWAAQGAIVAAANAVASNLKRAPK